MHMKKKRFSRHLMITLGVFVVAAVSGTFLVWKDMHAQQKAELRQNLRRTTGGIDAILAHAKQAGVQAMALTRSDCDEATRIRLRTIQASVPDIRSINLVKGNRLYCSSIYGVFDNTVDEREYISGQIKIQNSNAVTPYDALVVYRYHSGEKSVLVGINGYYFYHLLDIINSPGEAYLKIGKVYMNSAGRIFSTPPVFDAEITSNGFPYLLQGSKKQEAFYISLLQQEEWSLLTVFLLSLLVSSLVFYHLQSSVSLKNLLKQAISARQLTSSIQPVVDARTGAIAGGEVLMRWHHPGFGHIAPDHFIPLAEKSGLIISMTELSMTQLISEFGATEPGSPLFICFNVSSQHFTNKRLVRLCRDFLQSIGHKQIHLILEVTERETIPDNEMTRAIIQKLQALNVQFAIDDYGTGNANLNYITLFSPAFIKIDKQFTHNVTESSASALLVENIISLAKDFSCRTIAEGIETREQYDWLQSAGVDYLQGYYTGRPGPLVDFVKAVTG
ncbi:cyclic diguanylate phosphodiesterase [Salmonella enterica]|nr:cyclic diguanylate phosphodiesterase [Salmonella enterica]EDG3894791.1 EAL domain-containing protein [Salmonella enterica subsp. enterica serovar Litchfield]EBM2642197.1 cyclic diguanylate phosphodiesterase [Salmonella enterica]EBN9575658.1 cyclic diguanylate phosphodiesterase [Salmonella enterica]ECR0980451.1 cyclic diguanylate phosphodiesterase [Salmonella enterica]